MKTLTRTTLALGAAAIGLGTQQAHAALTPNETTVEVTYYVSTAVGASDNNVGTSSSAPLRTIKRAVEKARDDGKNSKVYIYNGTYVENDRVDHGFGEDMTKLLVIEGQTAGSVKITSTSTQSWLYFSPSKQNIVLRNLNFDSTAGPSFEIGGWEPVSSARYILIDNVQVLNNSGGADSPGAKIWTARDVTVKNSKFNNCNGPGAHFVLRDADISYCEFNNNQKSGKGSSDYFGGLAFAGANVSISNCKFNGNKGRGLRNDHAAQDINISNCEFSNNVDTGSDKGLGMQWEVGLGPITIKNSTLSGNTRGVQVETSNDVKFDGCTFSDNNEGAVFITWKNRTALQGSSDVWSNGAGGSLYNNPGSNWEYTTAMYGTRRTTITGCTLTTTKGASSYLIRKRPEDTGYDDYKNWYQNEYFGSNNKFYNSLNTNVFETYNVFTDLAGWKSATGEDSTSTWNGTTTGGGTTGTNLLSNPSFDAEAYNTQTPSGWNEWSNGNYDAGYTEDYGGTKSGARHGTHWKGVAYQMYTFQVKTGLTNGLYTIRAWYKGSGGQKSALFGAKNFGGTEKSTPIPANSGAYAQLEIKDINVTNGQCEVYFWSDANAGNWIYFDDVQLIKQ